MTRTTRLPTPRHSGAVATGRCSCLSWAVARVRRCGAVPGLAPGGRSAGDGLPDHPRSGRDGRLRHHRDRMAAARATGRDDVGRTGHGLTSRRPSGHPRDRLDGASAMLTLCSASVPSCSTSCSMGRASSPCGSRCGASWNPLYAAAYLLAMYGAIGSNSSAQNLLQLPLACRRWCWRLDDSRGFRPAAVSAASELADGDGQRRARLPS